ncbi:hypothetical protein N9971_00195 [bacterium]|nr:hypothetical protein [bacterium]
MSQPRVMLTRGAVADGRIQVTVTLADVADPLSALAMKFTYPSEFSRLVACDNGDVFGSAACIFSESDADRGLMYLGLTELGGTGTTPPTSPVVLARLTFAVFDCGAGAISIEGQNLGGSDGSALIGPANNVVIADWYGGVLSGG